MAAEQGPLRDLLSSHRDHEFTWVEPDGNHGDALIHMGAQKLAKALGLQTANISFETFVSGRVPCADCVYINGGGGLVPWWSGTPFNMLRWAIEQPVRLVVLGPSTACTDETFLRHRFAQCVEGRQAERVCLFARDWMSYFVLKATAPTGVEVMIDHDTALVLTAADLPARTRLGRYRLCAIREDVEARGEYSLGPTWVRLDPVTRCRELTSWIALHAGAREIATNRLHSAVLAAILGKRCVLLPCSYHKNRSVWEYSLASKGVEWRESLGGQRGSWQQGVALRIAQSRIGSWAIRRARERMLGELANRT